MRAAGSSETLVTFYQTTRRYIPKGSTVNDHRRENLRSYILKMPENEKPRILGFKIH
jgi:hypothetical protein